MKRLAYLFLCMAACIDADLPEDGIDDTFLVDGKADTGGITDGSPEAIAVLRVANEKTWTEMKDHGVPPQAASAIAAVRRGDDDRSTADDVSFTSLAQLDAVPWVGPQAFARLLSYARELGYLGTVPLPVYPPTDLWHVATCQPITFAKLASMFPSGATRVELHLPYTTMSQHRDSCERYVGCTPWQNEGAKVDIHEAQYGSAVMPTATRGTTSMNLYDLHPKSIYVNFTSYSPDAFHHDFDFACGIVDDGNATPTRCEVHESTTSNHVGFTRDFNDRLTLDGRICADGTYHFTSSVPEDQSNAAANLNQVALYGRLF